MRVSIAFTSPNVSRGVRQNRKIIRSDSESVPGRFVSAVRVR